MIHQPLTVRIPPTSTIQLTRMGIADSIVLCMKPSHAEGAGNLREFLLGVE